jgi:hypothetical protein
MSGTADLPATESTDRPDRSSSLSLAERLCAAIGLDAACVEMVAGDLAEEFAQRVAAGGRVVARLSYVGEVVRSAPHVIVYSLRRGKRPARLRLVACLLSIALALTAMVAAFILRAGPPVHMFANLANATDGIVINSLRPVQLEMRVLDGRGRVLPSRGIRFTWISGAPIVVSPRGVVSCKQHGDATVRASLGVISSDVQLRCRPVKELRASTWLDFVEGDGPRDLPFVAIGVDDRPVMQLRGAVRVVDR